MQYVKYVKYSLNDKRVDCSFKQEEFEDLCLFCTLNSFFFFVDVFEWIKDIPCGDMLMDVYTKT